MMNAVINDANLPSVVKSDSVRNRSRRYDLRKARLPIMPKTWLFMTRMELFLLLGICSITCLLTYPLYATISWWCCAGCFLTIFIIANAGIATRYCVPFPHICILVACIQVILAAWGNYYCPTNFPKYDLGDDLTYYLTYGGPACVCLSVGLLIPLLLPQRKTRITPVGRSYTVKDNVKIARELDMLFLIGISSTFVGDLVPVSLRFFVVLLSYLRYISVFGYLILGFRGWGLRAIVAFTLELYTALSGGMFHQLILWVTAFVFVLAHRKRWSVKHVVLFVIFGLFSIVVLQGIKQEFREIFWGTYGESSKSRMTVFSMMAVKGLLSPISAFSSENLSYTLMRLNQGWIVNQVMNWTPSMEPFAHGDTIKRVISASLLPRFLNPNKFRAGGNENFERFTGYRLSGRTSMDLGYVGEMYANFGYWGGLAGVGVYGLLLGMGFRWFYNRARTEPLWWAWAAYVGTISVKAESSLGLIVNWVVKATVVMIFTILLLPNMKRRLSAR